MPKQLMEFQIRTEAEFSPDELDYLNEEANHLSNTDNFDEDAFWLKHQKYEYTLITLDLYEVSTFNEFDEEHCYLRTDKSAFMVKMSYPVFKMLFQSCTGYSIKSTADYKIVI